MTGGGSEVRRCKEQHCIGTWNVRSMNQGTVEAVRQGTARVNTAIVQSVKTQRHQYHVTRGWAPTTNAEVERFYEDLQDLLEPAPKRCLFIIGDWIANVGSQEIPGETHKFGRGVQNEAGQRLTEFCQENTLAMANTLFQQHKRRLYTWTSPDGQY